MKAQSALEYIILLGIVLLVLSSVVYVFVLSGSDNSLSREPTTISQTSGRIAITNFQIDPIGVSFTMTNTLHEPVRILNVTADGTVLNNSELTLVLLPSQQWQFVSYSLYSEQKTAYSYDIVITYEKKGIIGTETISVDGESVLLDPDFLAVRSTEPLGKDLVLFAKFEDYTDSSGRMHELNATTGSLVNCVHGTCAEQDFDEATIFSVDNSTNVSDAFSFAFWLQDGLDNFDENNNVPLMQRSGSFDISIAGSSLNSHIYNGSTKRAVTSYNFPYDGQWHHIGATYQKINYNTYQATLYFDGEIVSQNSTVRGITPANNQTLLRIGHDGTILDVFFLRRMDEVMIWQRTLSADEMAALYRRGVYALNNS